MNKFLFALLLVSSVHAADSDILNPKERVARELIHLNLLIEATEWSLEHQQRLREKILDYEALQEKYLKDQNDNDLLYGLIKSAYTILEAIKTLHLETAFDPEFLGELSVLSKPVIKSGIPKP